jgi:hypothetical protein
MRPRAGDKNGWRYWCFGAGQFEDCEALCVSAITRSLCKGRKCTSHTHSLWMDVGRDLME